MVGIAVIDPTRFPRWLRGLLVLGLVVCALSVYLPGDWRSGDVTLYHIYAQGFWSGLPHPILPAEYPPLSVLPFGITLLGPAELAPDIFAVAMALVFVAGFFAFRRWASRRAAWTYVIYVLAAGPATAVFRYDLLAALMVVAGIWLLERRRFNAAYAVLAAGTLLKLFPLVFVPIVAIAEWRTGSSRHERVGRTIAAHLAATLGIVAAGFLAAYLADPSHGLGALTYNFRRPVEVESVPATLMWLGSLVGYPVQAVASYGSFNLTGPGATVATIVGDVGLFGGLLWVYVRQLQGRLSSTRAIPTALVVLLCTSKVLSAQYLVWVAVALAATFPFRMRWLAVFLLTALVFPTLMQLGVHSQGRSVGYDQLLLGGVAARNACLVICTMLLVRGVTGRASEGRTRATVPTTTAMLSGQPL